MKTLGYVVSVGARTSMGLDARQTGLFLRTGMPSVRTAPILDPEGGDVTMGFDPTIDPYLVGEARAAVLARAALAEMARPLGGFGRQLRVKVVLCLAEPRLLPGGFAMASHWARPTAAMASATESCSAMLSAASSAKLFLGIWPQQTISCSGTTLRGRG